MNQLLSVLLLYAATLRFAGAGAALPAQAAVIGVLVDSSDGRPVYPGRADLPSKRLTAFTDSLGRFVVGGLEPGQYRLYVRGIGYHADSIDVAVSRDTVRLAPVRLRRVTPPL